MSKHDLKDARQSLLKTTAVFRSVALSLVHMRTLACGLSQIKFCLGEDFGSKVDAEENGGGLGEQDWKKYADMVGGRPLKKVSLYDVNDTTKVLKADQMEKYVFRVWNGCCHYLYRFCPFLGVLLPLLPLLLLLLLLLLL